MTSKHPIQTTTNTSSTSSSTLPPPHTFTILPALHELLARIDRSNLPTDISPFLDLHQTPSSESAEIGSHYPADSLQPLQPKDLPEEVVKTIKGRIRAAVRAVEKLPDVERTCEEQEEEIRRLEGRIREQGVMLRGLGDVVEGMKGRVEGS